MQIINDIETIKEYFDNRPFDYKIALAKSKDDNIFIITTNIANNKLTKSKNINFNTYYLCKSDDDLLYELPIHSCNMLINNKFQGEAKLLTIENQNELSLNKGIGSQVLQFAEFICNRMFNTTKISGNFLPFGEFANIEAAQQFYAKNNYKLDEETQILYKNLNTSKLDDYEADLRKEDHYIFLPSTQNIKTFKNANENNM